MVKINKNKIPTTYNPILLRIKDFPTCTKTPHNDKESKEGLPTTPRKVTRLSNIQRQVLVGLLLGDGCLRNHNRSGKKTNSYFLTCLQSDKHRDYLFHLYEIFKEFTLQPPRYYEFTDPRHEGKTYKRWSFSTTLHSCFKFYGQQFYNEELHKDRRTQRVKRVSPLISRLLTPRSLAYWYMDDGAAKWQGRSLAARLCTDNFTLTEVRLLMGCLENKFSLQCTVQKKDGRPRIYIRHGSYPTLKNLIGKHLIPSMEHKFPREYGQTPHNKEGKRDSI